MRLRRKAGVHRKLEEEIKEFINNEPAGKKGGWSEFFGNEHPLQVEIGIGKGSFIIKSALLNRNINYVGLERIAGIIVAAATKKKQLDLPNLFLLLADAQQIDTFFAPGEVDRIYLNFSDPWPKKRHEKRRLTSPLYLDKYKTVLRKGGEIHLKTDDVNFFEYSLLTLVKAGFSVGRITYDLHKHACENNIRTEYEEKFAGMGKPICSLQAVSPQVFAIKV